MIFTQRKKRDRIPNSVKIQESDAVKQLGVILVKKLVIREHVLNMKGKAFSVTKAITPYINVLSPLEKITQTTTEQILCFKYPTIRGPSMALDDIHSLGRDASQTVAQEKFEKIPTANHI